MPRSMRPGASGAVLLGQSLARALAAHAVRALRACPPRPRSARPDAKWWFYCGQWFDKEHGLEKMLKAHTSDPRANMPVYTVTVRAQQP